MAGGPANETPVGRLLVERGVASLSIVEEAAEAAVTAEGRLCSTLLDSGACDEGDLAAALAERLGIAGVDLSRTVVDLAATDLVPRQVAEADLLLPLAIEERRFHVAVDSPERAARAIGEVSFVTGRDAAVYVAVLSSLRRAIEACYDARGRGATSWRGAAATANGPTIAERSTLPPAPGVGAEPAPATIAPSPRTAASAPLPDAPLPDAPLADAPPGTGEEVVHAVTAYRRRILVVDDEDAIRFLVEKALRHHGYDVETASDGVDALEKVQAGQYDLVLIDAMLPRMHGFDVAKRIRSDPARRDVRVVVMTAVHRGWRFAHDMRQSYGIHDYIEKPFRIDELLRRIDAGFLQPDPHEGSPLDAVVERGRAALAEGRLDEATSAFDEALARDPSSAEAHYRKGELLRLRGDAFRAMAELERAIELKPDQIDAVRLLASLYLQKGFRAKAAEAFERGIAATSDPRLRDQLRRELLRLL